MLRWVALRAPSSKRATFLVSAVLMREGIYVTSAYVYCLCWVGTTIIPGLWGGAGNAAQWWCPPGRGGLLGKGDGYEKAVLIMSYICLCSVLHI